MRTNRVKRLSAAIIVTIGLSAIGISPAVADSEHLQAQQDSSSSSSMPSSSSTSGWSWAPLKFWERWRDDRDKNKSPEGKDVPEVPGASVVIDGVKLTENEARMIELLNQHRRANGLRPVKVDQKLMDQSREWSRVQAREKRLYHGDYNVFENVAVNWGGDVEQFFEIWKNSRAHNRNMLNSSVTKAGFSYADSSSGVSYGTMQLMW